MQNKENTGMMRRVVVLGCAALLTIGLSSVSFAGSITDADSDGVPDSFDNCSAVANGPLAGACDGQQDADLDGFGNACDADWNDDGIVGGGDFLEFSAAFGSTPVDANWQPLVDSNCDDVIGGADFLLFSAQFSTGVPGPSGLACADSTNATAPCVAQ
jgi:hypothetical protein